MKKYIVPQIRVVEIGDVMSGLDIISETTDAEQLVNEQTFNTEEEEDVSSAASKSVWE